MHGDRPFAHLSIRTQNYENPIDDVFRRRDPIVRMRGIFLTAAILWGSVAQCRNGRDCAAAATASDKAICSNAQLKALDREFESKLEQTLEAEILFDPADLY